MKILLLAGEESGVLYAERLAAKIRAATRESVEIRGYQSEGFKTSDLAVMGFGPVLMKIFYFLGVAKTMKRLITTWRPDVVVTIDYPGLNLKLAAYAKAHGIPAIHLVCPQVWAWHQNRIPKVAAALTKLLCFFPFEPALFKGTGLTATFIGHPMVDVFVAEGGSARAVQTGGAPLLALLPGSRLGEIRRILPRLLASVKVLRADPALAGLRVVLPAANEVAAAEIARLVAAAEMPAHTVEIQRGGARDLLRRADCAAVASGTATLEAALAGCPTVLVYAVSPFLAAFARWVIKGIAHIGLANIIAVKSGLPPPMPELLQEAFTPESVAELLRRWLTDAGARTEATAALARTTALLQSDGDALGNAAHEILAVVDETSRMRGK